MSHLPEKSLRDMALGSVRRVSTRVRRRMQISRATQRRAYSAELQQMQRPVPVKTNARVSYSRGKLPATASTYEYHSEETMEAPYRPLTPVRAPSDAFAGVDDFSGVLFNRKPDQSKSLDSHPESGDLGGAETIFQRMLKRHLTEMREMVDVRVFNAFIQAYLATPSPPKVDRAMDWYRRLNYELNLKPNERTFGLLIRHFLKAGNTERVRALLADMSSAGIPAETLLLGDLFEEKEDKVSLEAFLRNEGLGTSAAHKADQLLLSALENDDGPSDERISPTGSSILLDLVSDKAPTKAATKPLPALKSVDALGVNIMRKALDEMQVASRADKFEQQQWLEERSAAAAVQDFEERLKIMPEDVRRLTAIPSQMVASWHSVFVPVLKREIETMNQLREDAEEHGLGRFLSLLPAEKLSQITISAFLRSPTSQEMDKGIMAGHMPMARLSIHIGSTVENEYNAQKMKVTGSKHKLNFTKAVNNLAGQGKFQSNTVRNVMALLERRNLEQSVWNPTFPQGIKAKIGGFLVERFLRVAMFRMQRTDPEDPDRIIEEHVPAFTHSIQNTTNTQKIGMISYHPELYQVLARSPTHVEPYLLPMLVTPQPWLTWQTGGYLQHRVEMVRYQGDREAKAYLQIADDASELTPVQKALDILGAVPWSINDAVLDVAVKMWNSKQHVTSLPSPIEEPPVEQPPGIDDDAKLRNEYYKKVKERHDRLATNFSMRADANYKLEIARAFLNENFYFPHNVDFRGRAYPIPAHLTHIGNDLCRGLLQFAEGKPLGEEGLRWLKIQVASLAGQDKASFEDREAFTMKHLAQVYESADRPLEGTRWWLQFDSPWQLLAACQDLTNALRSDHPTKYLSRQPIHQDGTCNGLQHYAALGGDELGARQVNLAPSEKPSDIYTGVADRVQAYVDEDSKTGVEEAILMKNRINRKLVKQTVMTNTYGVTFMGAKTQVSNRLKEARAAARHADKSRETSLANASNAAVASQEDELTDDQILKCSLYIAKKIFEAMGTLFEGARAIQIWLSSSANLIARSTNAKDIPPMQLEMAEQLAKMGVLPSAFTVANEVTTNVMDEQEKISSGGLLSALMEDLNEDASDEIVVGMDTAPSVATGNASDTVEAAKPASLNVKDVSHKVGKTSAVIWTTPLGLPCVQPYRNYEMRVIQTLLQTINIRDWDSPATVNPMKQSSAFPPNYIHSLDASHMMISAVACHGVNVTFAAVHDSYWTHACDVPVMNEILRESFVRLHSGDLMKQLRTEFMDRYRGHKLPVEVTLSGEQAEEWKAWCDSKGYKSGVGKKMIKNGKVKKIDTWVDLEFAPLPARGNFELEKVKDSKYFFN
ncbi:uncharacterized protein EV422DRAFT_523046 [Fimicolochytrium jonesii]|uniref:uncharacterized protein n=1 Tax=Fimicolochytrium jonesii TaxID=1396493 RepID=UPI0022FEA998|nr:uncharacterized protein EV422DRAFT_523046 [Fimicolochytrium jonesii]KAI8823016.1 hypothetical protein EV422DRAFT_523046 [Fimicolochytrium jonesii]